MKKFRLKKEAVPFFKEDLATSIYDFETWIETYNVDENALEEVEEIYLTYGHRKKESSWLCGWDENRGTHFHFTINFPSIDFYEHDKLKNGTNTRKLMDKIQRSINFFLLNSVNEEN